VKKRILIIEDTEDNRRILRDLLTHAGYDLVEADDGGELLGLWGFLAGPGSS
jgi:two-component system cell cycle response regulator DivK